MKGEGELIGSALGETGPCPVAVQGETGDDDPLVLGAEYDALARRRGEGLAGQGQIQRGGEQLQRCLRGCAQSREEILVGLVGPGASARGDGAYDGARDDVLLVRIVEIAEIVGLKLLIETS